MSTKHKMKFSFLAVAALALIASLTLSSCGSSGGGGGNTNTTPNPTYTVTYDVNTADSGSVPVDSNHYEQGQSVMVPGNPGALVKDANSFIGWNTASNGTGTTYTQAQTFLMGSANVILYAKWTTNPAYTVTYDGNGNTGGIVPVNTTNYVTEQTVMVFGNTGGLVNAGYAFAGWNTLSNGTGTTYGTSFTMGSANVTLYAKWTANPTYTVTYDGNGNTGGSVPTDSTNYEEGTTVTVFGNTGNLVNTGHSFAGWNTQADGNGTTYGATFAMGSTNVILYAKWIIVFTDNGDGTMTDKRTGLMWVKSPDSTKRTWQPALNYCDNLDFAGHSDWRPPTYDELSSLIQGWTGATPAAWLTSQGFSMQVSVYWSSTPSSTNPGYASVLDMSSGNGNDGYMLISTNNVWPVRTGP